MKNILVMLILIFSFVLSAKIVKVEGEYTYTYSDDETIVQAKKKCLDFAKRDALEKFATYISSESVYKNYMTEKDQVVARSLGVLKNVVINEENIDRANSTIFYKVSAEVDEEEVLKKLEKKQEKNTLNVKIKDFVRSGINAEKQLRIGDALKYYYWALLLVKSDSKSANLKSDEFDDRLLTIALPEKINQIMNSLEFKIKEVSESKKYKNIDFEMKYQGSSVRNLVLTYFNGDIWSQPVKVRDGMGNIELYGDAAESITKLSLKTGHKYEEQCKYDHNVKQALKKVGHIPFSAAKFKVKIPKAKKEVDEVKIQQAEEERLRKEKEAAYFAAQKKAEGEKLKKEMQDASILAKKQADEEARIRKEKDAASKEESMLDQHYRNTKNDPVGIKKSYFGFKGGINIATLSGDDVRDDMESETFYNFGMFSLTNINKNVAFQLELNYSQKGAYAEDIDEFGLWYASYTWTYKYLEIPLLLKLKLPIDNLNPNIYLGYSLGFLISAEDYTETDYEDDRDDLTDFTNSIDNSFIIGGGLDYILNNKTLLIFDIRYTMGLTSIWDEEALGMVGEDIEIDIYHSVFSINIGIGF